jgi:hypothetical protein
MHFGRLVLIVGIVSERAIASLKNMNRFIFVIEARCVYCEVVSA